MAWRGLIELVGAWFSKPPEATSLVYADLLGPDRAATLRSADRSETLRSPDRTATIWQPGDGTNG